MGNETISMCCAVRTLPNRLLIFWGGVVHAAVPASIIVTRARARLSRGLFMVKDSPASDWGLLGLCGAASRSLIADLFSYDDRALVTTEQDIRIKSLKWPCIWKTNL